MLLQVARAPAPRALTLSAQLAQLSDTYASNPRSAKRLIARLAASLDRPFGTRALLSQGAQRPSPLFRGGAASGPRFAVWGGGRAGGRGSDTLGAFLETWSSGMRTPARGCVGRMATAPPNAPHDAFTHTWPPFDALQVILDSSSPRGLPLRPSPPVPQCRETSPRPPSRPRAPRPSPSDQNARCDDPWGLRTETRQVRRSDRSATAASQTDPSPCRNRADPIERTASRYRA